jgi:hypothetical protein
MTESPHRPIEIDGLDKGVPTPKYLPGQRFLFSEEPTFEIVSAEAEAVAELFCTGRDLPGANETNQVIIWDVA